MKFFFDESGDFMVPRSWLTHRASAVVGVAMSDLIEVRLEADFNAFVARLSPRERPNGEPKGRCLTPEHRREFCDILARYDGVSVSPVTLDLSALSGRGFSRLPERMGELLEERSALMLHERAREELPLIGRQFKNLSVPQALRLFALANCFREALHHSIIFLANRGHEASWNAVRYEVDRVQAKNAREERVFSLMVLSWLTAWSFHHPIILVKELHTPDHPFVQNFDREAGVDFGRLVRDRIHWLSSKDSWGLQMADIAASIVGKAAEELDDTNGAVTLYGSLMRSSYYGPVRGPGLVIPMSEPDAATAMKYRLLADEMARWPRNEQMREDSHAATDKLRRLDPQRCPRAGPRGNPGLARCLRRAEEEGGQRATQKAARA